MTNLKETIEKVQESIAELEDLREKQKEIANRLGREINELDKAICVQYEETARILMRHFLQPLEKESNSIWKYAYGDANDSIYNMETALRLLQGVLELADKEVDE